jgi:hypothetical protein
VKVSKSKIKLFMIKYTNKLNILLLLKYKRLNYCYIIIIFQYIILYYVMLLYYVM